MGWGGGGGGGAGEWCPLYILLSLTRHLNKINKIQHVAQVGAISWFRVLPWLVNSAVQ